jgi:hypothetical protein
MSEKAIVRKIFCHMKDNVIEEFRILHDVELLFPCRSLTLIFL